MKILLVFPPQFDPAMPNLALPCLTAALQKAGHEVVQKDLNVESYDTLLSKGELENALGKIRANYQNLLVRGTDAGELNRLIRIKSFLINEVEHAKQEIRRFRGFNDNQRYLRSQKVIIDSLKLISFAYPGSLLTLNSYQMFYSPYATEQVLKAVQAPDLNLYHDFYTRYVIPEVINAAPPVLGISIAAGSQVIPGLTLAYLVKQMARNIHIVIGGNYFTIVKDKLLKNPALFSLIDSVVVYEGEIALVELLDCLSGCQELSKVPNLIYRDGPEIRATEIRRIVNLDSLPAPSFEGLPLPLYFSPAPVLPVYASRGCYWGKCAFCNYVHSNSRQYTMRDFGRVRADIEQLARRYKCGLFWFVDEALSPHYLEQLADDILAAGLKIEWATQARFEKEFDRELCAKLAKSGCRVLVFGLESACDRVLARMKKGNHPAVIREVLSASFRAGIINQISFFTGFPTETRAEAGQTLKFILDNIRWISLISFENFRLTLGSEIFNHPGEYQIEAIDPPKEYDLSWMYDYEVKQGLTSKESRTTFQLFRQVLAEFGFGAIGNSHMIRLINHYPTNDLLWATASRKEKLFGRKRFMANRLRKARQKAVLLLHDLSFFKVDD
jgi:hypothetical protein